MGNPQRIHSVKGRAHRLHLLPRPALGDFNICVNSLLPGSKASEGAIKAYGEAFFERGRASRSIKRAEKPEDLLGTLVYLCSSDSNFVTGQAIAVDGSGSMY